MTPAAEQAAARRHGATLFLRRPSRLTPGQSLGLRALAVIGLFSVAVIGHWLDRDGLKDNIDGSISFIDVVYFTAVTVTTVGYGDIVPVTDSARLFDTFVVTPIRLFVWLIFLGSAYSFFLERGWNQLRTRMIASELKDHVVVCGYGTSGASAVDELVCQGVDCGQIVVVDRDPAQVEAALATGVTAIAGDATHNAVLETARVGTARAVLVSPGRDDTAALIVLTARQLSPSTRISVGVRAVENEDLLRQAGADAIVNPVHLGGQLLARSSAHGAAVAYINDLAGATGRVALTERAVAANEVGQPLSAITTGLGVRLIRNGLPIGFWEPGAERLQSGDTIVEIVPIAR